MHGLRALVEMSVAHDATEGAQLLRFVGWVHGAIRAIPITHHAEALEIDTLLLDLLGSKLTTRFAKRVDIELLAGTTVLLFDGELDRQTMTIPTRDVGRVVTVEGTRLDDHIFENLIDGVADVDRAVGVRRTVVQHEARTTGCDTSQLTVDVLALEAREHLRFALSEIGLHGEVRLRQVDGVLVVGHVTSSSKKIPRSTLVDTHLSHERIESLEALFVAQVRNELDLELPAIEIARKIEYESLQQRLHTVDGRARPKTRHTTHRLVRDAVHPNGIDATERELASPNPNVSCREAELPTEFGAGHDAASDRIGSAKQHLRLIETSGGERITDDGAADALALCCHRLNDDDLEAMATTRLGQKCRIGLPCLTETKIVSDDEALYREISRENLDEPLAGERAQAVVEAQYDERIEPERLE